MSSVPGSEVKASEVSNKLGLALGAESSGTMFAVVLAAVDGSETAILAMVTSVRLTISVPERKLNTGNLKIATAKRIVFLSNGTLRGLL